MIHGRPGSLRFSSPCRYRIPRGHWQAHIIAENTKGREIQMLPKGMGSFGLLRNFTYALAQNAISNASVATQQRNVCFNTATLCALCLMFFSFVGSSFLP